MLLVDQNCEQNDKKLDVVEVLKIFPFLCEWNFRNSGKIKDADWKSPEYAVINAMNTYYSNILWYKLTIYKMNII